MKARNLYNEAVTKAAACIIAMSDPDKGMEALQDSLTEFTTDVKAKIATTLLEALADMKSLSTKELREIANRKDH